MKITFPLVVLVFLSGCWCGIEEKDTSNVSDYFSGCWSKLKNEKTQDSNRSSDN